MSTARLRTYATEMRAPFRDTEVSFAVLKRITDIDAASLSGFPYRICPNGQRFAWVSDIGVAANVRPSSIANALRIAHLDRLERG